MTAAEEVRLTRKQLAAALTKEGFPITAATLATKATKGGGPPYRLFGHRSMYLLSEGIVWAQSRVQSSRAAIAKVAA
jgi:hypothetical protein